MAQTVTERKKKRAKKRKKKQATARVQREMARKPSLRNDLALFQEGHDVKLKAVGRVCGTLWKNQQELDQAHHRLDTQQFVLARLLIPLVKEVLIRVQSDELITQETIGRVFLEWDEFRKRPDYKDLLLEWMMGVPLNELPPPPKIQPKPVETPDVTVEGPREFGGDYVEGQTSGSRDETSSEEQSEGQSSGEADEMPKVQNDDKAHHGEGPGNPEMP